MTGTVVVFALIAAASAAALLIPIFLWRRQTILSRAESAEAVLREKLLQIDRDQAAGLIGEPEAEAVRAEIARSLIATAREADQDVAHGHASTGSRGGMVAIAGLSFAIGVGVYAIEGRIEIPDHPLAGRSEIAQMETPTLASDHEGAQIADAITRLRARVETDPNDVENWHFLARSYSAIGAYEESAKAYARVIELAPFQIDIRGDYAETLIRAEGGFVGPKAVAELEIILTHAPNDPRALYYLGLRDAQNGDSLEAAERWAQILRDAPSDAPYRPAIRSILEAIIDDAQLDRAALEIPEVPEAPSAPGPSAADVAAATALPADEQMDMIRGMVDGLEARLADEPGDIEGWLRLARSRSVLGEPEAAVAALERALAANPGDPQLAAALADLKQP